MAVVEAAAARFATTWLARRAFLRSASDFAPAERGFVVLREQVSWAVINREATCIAKSCFGEASTAETNCAQTRLARSLGIVGRVADNNDIRLLGAPSLAMAA
jgi:hypothetical protein